MVLFDEIDRASSHVSLLYSFRLANNMQYFIQGVLFVTVSCVFSEILPCEIFTVTFSLIFRIVACMDD
jgi:hypothetical protein